MNVSICKGCGSLNVSYNISDGCVICMDCNVVSDYKTKKTIDFYEFSDNLVNNELNSLNRNREIGTTYNLYK